MLAVHIKGAVQWQQASAGDRAASSPHVLVHLPMRGTPAPARDVAEEPVNTEDRAHRGVRTQNS